MINVNKPFLPPEEEYKNLVDGIWKRGWLTNNGPLVNELETLLKEYLSVSNFLFLSNGTIAIQLAIKALDLQDEIITTPFSFVATTSSICWENCKPVFVDIDPLTFNIDPKKIEAGITKKTTAILATHVFGNPCQVEEIDKIAKKHNLKVIYDGAHSFGVTYNSRNIFSYGDISTTSFHATKLFHTIEGGAVISADKDVLRRLSLMRNFGHNGPDVFDGVGINGKNSEFHAAMGIVNMKYIEPIIEKRKLLTERYNSFLLKATLKTQKWQQGASKNYAYYPVLFRSEQELMAVMAALSANWVYARRYFYPSLNNLPYVTPSEMPVSEDIASRILCLPLYYDLSEEEVDYICKIILDNLTH